MLPLAASFALGIALSQIVPVGMAVFGIVSVCLAVIAFVCRGSKLATLAILAAFLSAGGAVQTATVNNVSPNRLSRIYDEGRITTGLPLEMSGKISGSIESAPEGIFILVDLDYISVDANTTDASGRIRLFAPFPTTEIAEGYRSLHLQNGASIKFSCEPKRDDEFRNPGGLPRRKMLEWQGLDASCTLSDPYSLNVIARPNGFGPVTDVFTARERLIEKFRELFNPQTAGVMIASLLGNKHFLDKSTADIFRDGGTFHILVISGLHITFIGGLAAIFVGFFTKRKALQFVIVCAFLWFYTIAVGAEIPVVRASLMFTFLWFSFTIHRTGSLANALGVCGVVLLVWRPNDLFSPSFQLTFVSVGAIVIAAFPLIKTLREIGTWTPTRTRPFPARVPEWLRRFCETLYWNERSWEIEAKRDVWSANLFKAPLIPIPGGSYIQKFVAYLFEGILVSAIVQAAMLPLTVHYFHRVTPASIPLNLWTGVLIAFESFASLFAVVFSYISDALAWPLIRLAEFFNWLMVVPGRLGDYTWLSFRVPIYPGIEFELYSAYFIFVALVALAAFVWDPFTVPADRKMYSRTTITLAGFLVVLFGTIIIFHPFSTPRPDGRLHVEFIDVGQGDSIFITFPNGETMLVDGGGRRRFDEEGAYQFEPDVPSIGEMVVSEFLWQKGYSKIDRIVATHADADHIQGLSDVARNFRIGEAWLGNSAGSQDSDQLELEAILAQNKVPVKTVARGDKFVIGGSSVEVLNPGEQTFITSSENDRSVVMRITFGERSFMLTGDTERATEAGLLNETDLRADVVKVAHHGSKTSSTESFVNASRPQFAVIPVGRRSPFHHPNKDVVERWIRSGAVVMTTGEYGTLRFSTDGKELSVRSYVQK